MKRVLPRYLQDVLELLVQGHSRKSIAEKYKTTIGVINKYVYQLKIEFIDEPEIESGNYKLDRALVIIGQRYFNFVDSAPWSPLDIINFLQDYTNKLYQLRVRGDPRFAITLADTICNNFKEKILTDSKHQQTLLSLYTKVLSEKAMAYRETISFESPLKSNLPISKELRTISKLSRDAEPEGLAFACLAQSYYLDKKYDFAIQNGESGLEYLNDVHDELILRRTLALSYAYLQITDKFHKQANRMRALIERGNWSHAECICTVLEGIGRGEGILKLPQAIETINEAEGVYERMSTMNERAPFRNIQLVRSKLEVVYHLHPRDIHSLEEIGNNGIKMAEMFGYPKYISDIQGFLETALN